MVFLPGLVKLAPCPDAESMPSSRLPSVSPAKRSKSVRARFIAATASIFLEFTRVFSPAELPKVAHHLRAQPGFETRMKRRILEIAQRVGRGKYLTLDAVVDLLEA